MLSDEYIIQQALERKWVTQEQIDLCSVEKNKNESVLDVLIAKDFLSKEQVEKLTWEDLEDDDCFLSSDLKLKVMSVDDLTFQDENQKSSQKKPKQTEKKEKSSPPEKPQINLESLGAPSKLTGEGSALAAHALVGEDSSFEEPIFGESSTFVQAAAFAEDSLGKIPAVTKSKEKDSVDKKMRKSSDPEEEILEFDNDFLESTDGSREFTISSSIESEDVSGELESLRSDSTEFTISGNIEIPESIKKRKEEKPKQTKQPEAKTQTKAPKTTSPKVVNQKVEKIRSKSSRPTSGKSMSTPFGKAAILLKMATEEQVNDALLSQVTDCKGKKIGKIMAEKGYLTNEQIKTILARQKTITMVCPECEKKYQIVLFQPGRSYKCKSPKCPDTPELMELKKYAKKRKAMINISQSDIDVMGLTGEISKSQLHKQLKKDIYQQTGKEISDDSVVTTSDLLKEVGIGTDEIVANIEVEEKKESGAFVWILVLILFGGSLFFAYQTGILNKLLDDSNARMNKAYQEILVLQNNQPEQIQQKIDAYSKFQKEYPENPYTKSINNEVYSLRKTLFILKIEELLGQQNVLETNTIYKSFVMENPEYTQDREILYLEQKIADKSNEMLDQLFSNVDELVVEQNFDMAINLLENAKKKQVFDKLSTIDSKIQIIEKKKYDLIWQELSQELSRKTYSFLHERKYKEAISSLTDSTLSSSAEMKQRVSLWKNYLESSEKVWKSFSKGLEKSVNVKTVYAFDIGNDTKRANTKILQIDFRGERLKLDIRKILSFNDLNEESIKKIISLDYEYNAFEEALFLSCWKSKFSFNAADFTSFEQEIITQYIFMRAETAIQEKNIYDVKDCLVNISILNNTSAYQAHKESLALKLIELSRKEAKFERIIQQLVVKYLPDTSTAKRIKNS